MSYPMSEARGGRSKYGYINTSSRPLGDGSPLPYRVSPNYDGYDFGRPDTLNPSRWNPKYWSWKIWTGLVALVVIIIVVIVVAVVETNKNNAYPDYSPLNYTLADTYSGTDFFANFDYMTGYDPAQGFVHYVPSARAESLNLTYASLNSAVVRVDTSVTSESVPNASTGRFSVRLTSKKQYNDGLFIFDVLHTPIGCGTWPALWLSDPSNWPYYGEIDIMEAVNVPADAPNAQNQMTLHTTTGCTMSNVKRLETGSMITGSCVNSTDNNAGCGVDAGTNTFGANYNNQGGGIMAMELRTAGIRIWQFSRNAIPADVTSGQPNPASWPEATADFPSTDCDIGTHFRNQSIIANIDLCGTWAGSPTIYSQTCSGTCEDQVANNATAFLDSYWEFGSFKVYSAS